MEEQWTQTLCKYVLKFSSSNALSLRGSQRHSSDGWLSVQFWLHQATLPTLLCLIDPKLAAFMTSIPWINTWKTMVSLAFLDNNSAEKPGCPLANDIKRHSTTIQDAPRLDTRHHHLRWKFPWCESRAKKLGWSLPMLVWMGLRWPSGGGSGISLDGVRKHHLCRETRRRRASLRMPRTSKSTSANRHTNASRDLDDSLENDEMIPKDMKYMMQMTPSISTHPSQYCFTNERPIIPENIVLLWQEPPWSIQFQPSLGRVEVEHRTLQPNTHASFHIVSQRPHFSRRQLQTSASILHVLSTHNRSIATYYVESLRIHILSVPYILIVICIWSTYCMIFTSGKGLAKQCFLLPTQWYILINAIVAR